MTKAELRFLSWTVLIGLPIWAVAKLDEVVGWERILGIVVGTLALYFLYQVSHRVARRARLKAKYGDKQLVSKLMSRSFWTGQTAEQLIDSLGAPFEVDKKVLRSKRKEVWKYNHEGANRCGLRITLDDDIVVGWDQKN